MARILTETQQQRFWAYRKFDGVEEYMILHETPESKDSYDVKNVTTGKKFNILLHDDSRLRI